MFDPLSLCDSIEDGAVSADPGTFFPAVIARIKQCREQGIEVPDEINNGDDAAAKHFMEGGKNIPLSYYSLAVIPYQSFAGQFGEDILLLNRRQALEFAEAYFSRALLMSPAGQFKLRHIIKNDAWKR